MVLQLKTVTLRVSKVFAYHQRFMYRNQAKVQIRPDVILFIFLLKLARQDAREDCSHPKRTKPPRRLNSSPSGRWMGNVTKGSFLRLFTSDFPPFDGGNTLTGPSTPKRRETSQVVGSEQPFHFAGFKR